MKYFYFILTILLCTKAFSQASYTSSSSGLWNVPATWTLSSGTDSDGDGIPDSDDNVTIAATHTVVVPASVSCLGFTMSVASSAVAVNAAATLNVTGNFSTLAGNFTGTGTLNITGASVIFGNTTAGPTLTPAVVVSTQSITSQRSTYFGSVTITKNPPSIIVDNWRGGNTFHGTFTLTNATSDPADPRGDIYLGSNAGDPVDIFNGRASFYVTGCARIRVPQSGTAIFYGVASFFGQGVGGHDKIHPARFGSAQVTFHDSAYFSCNSVTSDMQIAYDAGTSAIFNGPVVATHAGTSAAEFLFGNSGSVAFNNNIIVNNTGTGTISITPGNGSSTLANGRRILVGSAGFTSGTLNIVNLTQVGTTAQTFTMTGTSDLRIGDAAKPCVFNAAVNFTAPNMTLEETTYNGAATFVKTGLVNNSAGKNTFNNTLNFTLTGIGNMSFSNLSAADVFASTVTVTSTGAGIIGLSRSYNTSYPQNIILNSTSTGGIYFGNNGGTTTLASGRTFSVGGTGFSSGTLLFRYVNTPTAQTLSLGTAATFSVGLTGTGNTFGSNVNFTAGTLAAIDNSIAGQATLSGGSLVLINNTITGNAVLSKTGTGADDCGANRFNGAFTLTNSGAGGIRFSQTTGADVFAGTVTVSSPGNGGITMSRTYNTTYPENIQVSNTGTNGIFFGFNGGGSTLSAGKTIATSTFSAGTLELRRFTQLGTTAQNIGLSGTASVRFGNGINTSCYFNGDVTVNGSTGTVFISDSSFFYRNMTVIAGSVVTTESQYNAAAGTTSFTKTGTPADVCGKNSFNGLASFTNTGTGTWQFAQVLGGDVFQNDLTLTNGSTGGIAMSRTYASTYNGNVYANSYGGAGVVSFGAVTGASTMAATKSINTVSGFSTGTFTINRFTQNGTATNTLTMTGSANLSIGTATYPSDFGGDVTIVNNSMTTANSSTFRRNFTMSTNGMQIEGCNFNSAAGSTSITKSQTALAEANGGNTFYGPVAITHNGNIRLCMSRTNGPDLYASTVTLTANSSYFIDMSHTYPSAYQNTITLNSSSNGGITFGAANGTSNQSANMSISTGTFTGGSIDIRKFNQASGSQTNTLILPANSSNLTIGTSATTACDFGGIMNISCGNITTLTSNQFRKDFTCSSASVSMVSNTFNGTSGNATVTKTGFQNDDTNGGNVFTASCTLTNNGSGRLRMSAATGGDTYGGVLTLNNTNGGALDMARSFATVFSDNIVISNTSSGGVSFGAGASGNSTQAANKSITTSTFTTGPLSILRFTQASGTQVNSLVLTGSNATIAMGATGAGNTIGGDITMSSDVSINMQASTYQKSATATAPGITMQNNTFNSVSGSTAITKTGTGNDDTNGGNTFNGTTVLTITASGGRLRLGTTADDFNGDLTLVQSQTAGILSPSYNANSAYSGNVTVTSPASVAMIFGSGGAAGITTFDGSNAQTFSISAGSAIPTINRMVMNKPGDHLTLNTRVNVGAALTMTRGNIITSQTEILNMNDNSTATIGNALSYIDGPMNYDMAANNTTRTLNMPLGKGGDWRPAVLTVRHSNAASYTYNSEMFNLPANYLFWTQPATVDTVSSMRYWDIHRYITGTTTVASNTNLSYNAGVYPLIQLYFGTNDGVYQGSNLTIVKNTAAAPTSWIDIGGTSAIGNNSTPVAGSVTSTSSPTAFNSFSRFTLGSKTTGMNPLPVNFVAFDAVQEGKQAHLTWTTAREENSNYFDVEHSTDGISFESIGTVEAAHFSNASRSYTYTHADPAVGLNYYRIKEYDYNNSTTVTSIRSLLFKGTVAIRVYPNPVSEVIHFAGKENAVYNIVLYGSRGEMLKSAVITGKGEIDIRYLGLASGIYLMKVESDGVVDHIPLVIGN